MTSTPPRRTLSDWLELAQKYHDSGETQKAEALLKKLIEAQPGSAHLLNLLGNLYADRGQHDEAVELFRRALTLTEPDPALLANLGRALEARGDHEDAFAVFVEAVALDPENPGAHYQLAVTFQRHGRHARAAAAFERALQLDPDNVAPFSGRGAALQSLGRLDEAIECYDRALALDGDHPETLNNLAIIHQMRGQADRAVALLRRVVALKPSAEAYLNLGRALLDAGQLDEAEAIVERARSMRPRFAAAELARAQILERTGRLELAHSGYAEALELDAAELAPRLHLARLNRRLVPRWHFPMLNDERRNRAYDAAVRRVVSVGDVVLDIGTGSGLLAMMAARAGAGHVYACEAVPIIAERAEQIIRQNGFADRISVIPKSSTDLVVGEDLPGRVDVLVCEIFDTGLLSEGVVPVLEHARGALVKPGGKVLPRGATVYAALVESSALRAEDRVVATGVGFDVSAFNAFADTTYSQRDLTQFEHRLLTRPLATFTFDFAGEPILDQRLAFDVEILESGRVDAIVFWFSLDLDGHNEVSTRPDTESCWRQAVQIVEPTSVRSGATRQLTARHDGNMIAFTLEG